MQQEEVPALALTFLSAFCYFAIFLETVVRMYFSDRQKLKSSGQALEINNRKDSVQPKTTAGTPRQRWKNATLGMKRKPQIYKAEQITEQ